MKYHPAAACARCGGVGMQRHLDELLRSNRDEPAVALCDECLHLLKYADAKTWNWFRKYRDRLTSREEKWSPRSRFGLVGRGTRWLHHEGI